jgi:homoserine O-acetyltransferase
VDVAWQSWGRLDSKRSNAVLVCHALSGDSNAAGWWSRLIGPGRAIDPAKWFVIGTNALGGCQGTTGPGTLDAEGRRLGSRFPAISVGDMVEVQARLLDELGIRRLALVIGGSMGGMQALEWAASRPERVAKCAAVASCRAHSAMQIGFNEAARQAVMRDPKWRGGDFAPDDPPRQGLAVARMLGHLSYLSDAAFTRKFGRERTDSPLFLADGAAKFQVESYLAHQGEKFTHRFDAGSLVTLSRAIDAYESGPLLPGPELLILSWSSDWLYPTRQSEEIREWALRAGARVRTREIEAPFGHDSFLLDDQEQAVEIASLLDA